MSWSPFIRDAAAIAVPVPDMTSAATATTIYADGFLPNAFFIEYPFAPGCLLHPVKCGRMTVPRVYVK
jgi:hypothetical protein